MHQVLITALSFAFCGAWGVSAMAADATSGGTVSTIAEVLKLTDADLVPPAEFTIRGVLTYFEPGHGMAFVQDKTASIFLQIRADFEVTAGDESPGTGEGPTPLDPATGTRQLPGTGKTAQSGRPAGGLRKLAGNRPQGQSRRRGGRPRTDYSAGLP